MAKIRLGGIKIIERHSHLATLSPPGGNALSYICYRLAAERINLALLTHLADSGGRGSFTAACTDSSDSFSSYFLLKVNQENVVKLQSEVNILSIFPHDQRPAVAGALMSIMANRGLPVHGLASSPSALSMLISSADTGKAIDGLFDVFDFPTYRSPYDWHAAYKGQEQVLKEIICSYQEEIIKIYTVSQQTGLDLWQMTVPLPQLAAFSAALSTLDEAGIKLPFLVAQSQQEGQLFFALCLAEAHAPEVGKAFSLHLPDVPFTRREGAAAFFLHGPHFGDRYGIANTLVETLNNADVRPLAVCCAVSSISVAVPADDLERIMEVVGTRFQIPPPRAKK